MRVAWMMAAVAVLGVAGCESVTMTPLNQQAQAQGSPRLLFTRGIPGGPMKIVMPSGESLAGYYSISEQGTADGVNFHADAHGPRTTLACTAKLVGGHGPGECRGQDGAAYSLTL